MLGQASEGSEGPPTLFDAIFRTYQIMEAAIVEEKLNVQRPTILVRPAIRDVRMLEFHKADEIYHRAAPTQDQFRRDLEACLNEHHA